MENVQTRGTFFMAFIVADYNRWLWNYKITRFTIFVRGGLSRDWCKVLNVRRRGSYENRISANKRERGSKFWSFCDNVIIDPEATDIIRVYLEIPFSEGLCRIGAIHLICDDNRLTGFCMEQSFTGNIIYVIYLTSFYSKHNCTRCYYLYFLTLLGLCGINLFVN